LAKKERVQQVVWDVTSLTKDNSAVIGMFPVTDAAQSVLHKEHKKNTTQSSHHRKLTTTDFTEHVVFKILLHNMQSVR
jgi:hypothetical protein